MSLRNIPIKHKLMIIVMTTAIFALVLAGLGIVIFDLVLYRATLRRDLSALAQIIADNSTAALSFNDSSAASETLASLRARPHLASACIYRTDGSLLAKYQRPGVSPPCPPPAPNNGVFFGKDDVRVSQVVLLNGRPIGALMLAYDLGELSQRLQLFGATVLGVILVSGLIALLLSSALQTVITTPISQLVHAVTSVSQTGDYSIRTRKSSGDELGVLVDRFNGMLAGIETRDNNLKTALRDRELALRDAENARERLRFMAESMPQKIFTAQPDGQVDYLNGQWVEFAGLPYDELMRTDWTALVHPEDREENLRQWRRSIETGEPLHVQHRFRRADGAYRWHLTRALAMRDEAGRIAIWIGSNTDIHEQKEKEEELRRANEDLQQFAYSASHDLQEPIRNVAIYSEIVRRRYENLLDDEGRQFLGFMAEGGRRLATLVDDLLAYTRAGAVENSTAPVDAGAVLELALFSLAEAIRECGATVTYDRLPELGIGAPHLQQVFQNLIGNALKYRKEEAPRIHVSAVADDGVWRFAVQDNGIGIDPQYKEKIFGIFKRLHRDRKYAGTGIGLAICQRVVGRYGGRIWVESEPGRGSTFFFTVPQLAGRVQSASAGVAVS